MLTEILFVPWIYRSELRLLAGFELLKSIRRVATQIVFQLDRLVVAAFLPIAAVTYCAGPLSLTQRVMKLVGPAR